MIAVKTTKWIIGWKKTQFADLVKDAKSVAGFSPSCQFRVGQNDVTQTQPGCQVQFQNGSPQSHILGSQDSRQFRGQNFGEWKTQCFLAYR